MLHNLIYLSALSLVASPSLLCQDQPIPEVQGVITHVTSSTDFAVDGHHVLLPDNGLMVIQGDHQYTRVKPADQTLYLGESVKVFGKTHGKDKIVQATRVELTVAPPSTKIIESGIVDALPPATTASPDHLVRASGYTVRITPNTAVSYMFPLTASQPIRTDLWIGFEGTQQPDGIVLADKVVWAENTITDDRKKIIDKTDYDAAAVDPDSGQTFLSKALLGIDPKKIPPYEDHTMQARITAIGEKLIPQYQRDLPAADPTKINFRFQLVDEASWHQPITLVSGITLVPFQLVDRMQNDSQLAAILADNIAYAIEKQAIDTQVALKPVIARAGLTTAGAFFPPLALGLLAWDVAGIPGGVAEVRLLRKQDQERLRVSLCLLHDAGYDIYEAPHAWWLLNSKKKDLAQIAIPSRATYLYQVLGTTWRNQNTETIPNPPTAYHSPQTSP